MNSGGQNIMMDKNSKIVKGCENNGRQRNKTVQV